MSLSGKKFAMLAEADFEDLELWYPTIRMREAGAEVVIVGSGSSDTYLGKHGLPVEVDIHIDQARAEDFDAVIIPGGWAPDRLRRYPAVLAFVKDMDEASKIVAAICHGGWVPASAGILKGKTMTCVVAIKDDVINAGAKYVDQAVVVDGNLITSRTPVDLPDFCREIIKALS
ncbi:MAG: type 1 glutamine amidotransferase domain-containing protein [Candidatus Heimdallarchaeota archaeon]